ARALSTGETVALKVLFAEQTPASIARFEREARIAEKLDHPHIVRGRGAGRSEDGTAYIAMEFLEGENLETRLARLPLTPADAVTLAIQVCSALEYAHERGIVHRDLKPQNVFVCNAPGVLA